MQHLTLEDLARLCDEAPSHSEAAHLAECGRCAEELNALKEQTCALSALGDLEPPAAQWFRIEHQLRVGAGKHVKARREASVWLRLAAGIALFLAGGAVGYTLGSPPAAPNEPLARSDAAGLATAAAEVSAAETTYLRALTHYAEMADDRIGLDPISRLAALEGIVLTTGAALREAPADPVINNYHLTALGHREALLRQLEQLDGANDWF